MRGVLLPVLVGALIAGTAVIATARAEAADAEILSVIDGIEVSHVRLHDPLPASTGPHPAACDDIEYLRYRLADGPDDPQRADAVLVAQPAAFMGAFSMDRVARNVLTEMRGRGEHSEWWSLPQRSGCAFDTTGLATGDADAAFGYYYEGAEVDGRRFDGFHPPAFLADIGLKQMAHDEYTVLTTRLPSAEFRSSRVFCGGHADGALATAAFGAWDFDGSPGSSLCAGFFGLDGLINTDWLGMGSNPLVQLASGAIGGRGYLAAVQAMRSGAAPVTFAGIPGVAAQAVTMLPIAGLGAGPGETDLNRRMASNAALASLARPLYAGSYPEMLTGAGGLGDDRLTGDAFLGALFGNTSANLSILQTSIGDFDGPVAPKTFPLPSRANGPASGLLGTAARMTPTDPNHLYGWRSGGTVDIHDLSRQLGLVSGDLAYVNPYYTTRFFLDLLAAFGGDRSPAADLGSLRYEAELRSKPTLTVIGDASLQMDLYPKLGLLPADTVYAHGYTHQDVVTGATPDDGTEPVAAAVATFLTARLPAR
ncbi:hypothetical protein [Nocardia sp. CDC160]|uniref:hypothetical protein n=1 Tax=Nocardia sp. CDC160 TaxID=3112166 RepID=UPI002DB6A7A4|nr:hypothetical protein [Nocardia sp. CDC160]MEC3915626.1 hypothetical protein [Nocardia sp. CDC160]